MNEAELFHACRHALGMSQKQIARRLLLQSDRNIRRWEDGAQAVSGPAWIAVQYMLQEHGEDALAQQVATLIQERLDRTWRNPEEPS